METVFEMSLGHPPEAKNHASAYIELPAMPCCLWDALDRVRVSEGRDMTIEVTQLIPDLEFLAKSVEMQTGKASDLFLLNDLAEKYLRMNYMEFYAFEGLVRMDLQKGNSKLSIARLYNLASSTGCCHVIPEAVDDASLGRFYVDGGFMPEYESLPDEILNHLNYEKIGREAREAEGGVFIDGGGYVVQHEEIVEAAKNFVPRKPDYTVLLEIRHGEITGLLKMPSTVRESASALEAVGASDWPEVSFQCVDCKIPTLTDAITSAEDPDRANQTAQMLEKLNDRDAVIYKALLDATDVPDLEQALQMMDGLDQYLLTREYASAADVGLSHLQNLVGPDEAEYMLPYVDLSGFGESMIQRFHYSMTPYGAIERRDGEPIREADERKENTGILTQPHRKHREPAR